MQKYYYQANIAKSIAHPVRLEIINMLLKEKKQCVCMITEKLNVSQSAVSKHLDVLKKSEIVDSEKDGLRVWYFIKNKEISVIMKALDNLLIKEVENKQKIILGENR